MKGEVVGKLELMHAKTYPNCHGFVIEIEPNENTLPLEVDSNTEEVKFSESTAPIYHLPHFNISVIIRDVYGEISDRASIHFLTTGLIGMDETFSSIHSRIKRVS